MRFFLSVLFYLFLSHSSYTQKHKADTSGLAGSWSGKSICQVKSSPCNNELVVYYITLGDKENHYTITMNKIVNVKEEDMAVIPAVYTPADHKLVGTMKNYPAWNFAVKGKTIDGHLLLPDGTIYRVIHVEKQIQK